MAMNRLPVLGAYFTQTQDTLTDSSGGTANTTIVEVTDTTSDVSALINANFADVAAQLAKIEVDVAAIMTALNAANS